MEGWRALMWSYTIEDFYCSLGRTIIARARQQRLISNFDGPRRQAGYEMCLGDTGGSRKGRALADLLESG